MSALMMKEAFDDVKRGLAIRKAARNHGIPESTLRLRLSKGQQVAKMGAPTIFTYQQEEQLAQHCIKMAHLGYGFTRWQIMDMAKNMCSATGQEGREPSKHWFYGFLRRFEDVKMVNPKKREKAREDAVDDIMLDNYFNELTKTLESLELKNVPENIWNVDETAISLDHNPPKILAKSGTKPFMVTAGRSANTTLIAAGSALGQTIPPYIIFKGDRLSKEKCCNGLPGTQYRATSSGWSNSATFLDFFTNHFLKHVKARPCLLLYDGHSTHINSDIVEEARKENVHLFVLPPHSSHILQPLDVSVFSAFKKSLSSEFHKYLHLNPNRVITVDILPELISNSYKSTMHVSNIMAGFRKSGIFPLDPTAPTVKLQNITKKESHTETTRKERKDNRNVKILFEESTNHFQKTKEENSIPKRKRKSFIPPYGANITEDNFYIEVKKKKEEKVKQDEKKNCTEVHTSSTKNRKGAKQFRPPFIVIGDEKEMCSLAGDKSVKRTGKGPRKDSLKQKSFVKKNVKQVLLDSEDIEDEENCVVCGKWQPDGLRLDIALKFVDWGQCGKCKKWVHLKFCCPLEHLDEDDDFLCPVCYSEE